VFTNNMSGNMRLKTVNSNIIRQRSSGQKESKKIQPGEPLNQPRFETGTKQIKFSALPVNEHTQSIRILKDQVSLPLGERGAVNH
jgi:hypothetical protein